jgi:lysozyme
MASATGIDVSAYQGDFPWEQHRDIAFAGIRATSWGTAGLGEDPDLKRNANTTWDLFGGKVVRIYYTESMTARSAPDVQAAEFLRICGRHLCHGDVLAVAMGDTGGNGGMSPREIAAWHGEMLHHLRLLTDRQHRVLAYCDPAWSEAGNCEGLGGWPLWLASYGIPAPVVPRPWREWKFWQSSGTGLDRDVYNGSLRDLQDWAGMPTYRR